MTDYGAQPVHDLSLLERLDNPHTRTWLHERAAAEIRSLQSKLSSSSDQIGKLHDLLHDKNDEIVSLTGELATASSRLDDALNQLKHADAHAAADNESWEKAERERDEALRRLNPLLEFVRGATCGTKDCIGFPASTGTQFCCRQCETKHRLLSSIVEKHSLLCEKCGWEHIKGFPCSPTPNPIRPRSE